MKQFLITLLAVGVLASAAQADARLVSKRAECVAACGTATAQTCGWITKRGRYNYCRAKLINKCKRFGVEVMCPPPPAPPVTTTPTTLPIVTPTTVPVVVTTTTTPYIPPTTTTLPPVALDWTGFWSFTGTKVQDSCPPGIADTYFGETFSIVQTGSYVSARAGSNGVTLYGSIDPDTGFTVAADWTLDGVCYFRTVLAATPGPYSVAASLANGAACPTFTCESVWDGTLY